MGYTEEQKKTHIREIQSYLHGISCHDQRLPSVLPSGVYDARTAEAVRRFQKIYGLTETGEVNETTWNRIAAVYRAALADTPEPLYVFPQKKGSVMQPGDRGFAVLVVQAVLAALAGTYQNMPTLAVTGTYDMETAQAVQLFQNVCALDVTGSVDCSTWNMLAQVGYDLRS